MNYIESIAEKVVPAILLVVTGALINMYISVGKLEVLAEEKVFEVTRINQKQTDYMLKTRESVIQLQEQIKHKRNK